MKKYLAEFSRYGDGTTNFNGFWEIQGNRLVNQKGGWHDYEPRPDDEIFEVENYEDLTFRKYYVNNKYKTGWLDRNGNFFGCDFMEHSTVAYYCFHKEEYELEDMGWVKISRDLYSSNGLAYYHVCILDLTDAQKKWLIDNGFSVRDA